jgi:outer membrane lipase/esterase
MFFGDTFSRLASRALTSLAAVVALASCGGGTYQVSAFVPDRILTFGDETNVLVPPQGLKYSVNGLSAETDLPDCTLLPLWNQVLATSYNMVYAECNPEAVAQPTAFNFSTVGAQVDDVTTQVDSFLAGDSFNGNDLVTIWVGVNDVLDIYTTSATGGDESDLIAQARARGAVLAGIVNEISNLGAKVLVVTIPDMGQSPFAFAEQETHSDFNRIQLLSDMANGFNRSMRSTVVNDGSKIGLVLADDYVNSAVRSPSSFGYAADAETVAGCATTAPLPNCDEDTLITDPDSNTSSAALFLWADPTHLGSSANTAIGNQANERAHSNPF